jgi:hypothetical protein
MDVPTRKISSVCLALVLLLLSCCVNSASAYNFTGTVYAGSNKISGATVTLQNASTLAEFGTVVTDAQGGYQFTNVGNGTYILVVTPLSLTGFQSFTVNGIVVDGTDLIQNVVATTPGWILSGKIGAPGGVGLRGIQVWAQSDLAWLRGFTNADGIYTFAVSSGTYSISLFGDPTSTIPAVPLPQVFSAYWIVENLSVTSDTTKDIELPLVTLSGKTTDKSGNPVPNVQISVTEQPMVYKQYVIQADGTTSDASGDFSLPFFAGTGYKLTFTPAERSGVANTVVSGVDVQTSKVLDFALDPAFSLNGTVINLEGIALAGLTVYINEVTGLKTVSATTDAQGRYSAELPPGTYSFGLSGYYALPAPPALLPQWFDVTSVVPNQTVTSSTTQDIVLPVYIVDGHVTDHYKNPVPDVQVSVATTSQIRADNVKSDASGYYRLPIFAGKGYTLTAVPPQDTGLAQRTEQVDVTSSRGLDFVVDPGLLLSGTVKTPTGAGISDLSLNVRNQVAGTPAGEGTTDAQGQYAIEVASGTYSISLTGAFTDEPSSVPLPQFFTGDSVVKNLVVTSSKTRDIVVPLVTLSGTVTDGTAAVADVAVSVVPNTVAADEGSYTIDEDETTSDNSGRYSIPVISGTGYSLTLKPPAESGLADKTLDGVAATVDRPLDIALRPLPVLTVVRNGTGSGTVSSAAQSVIDCGSTCSARLEPDVEVSLTATAAVGSLFTGWAGCATNSGATCVVTMTVAKTVIATFNLPVVPPTISGKPLTDVVAFSPYTFTPVSTGATSFSIKNRPSWATFDTGTGTLSGTPHNIDAKTTTGIVISASNEKGTVDLPMFSLTVRALANPVMAGTPVAVAKVTIETPFSFKPGITGATSFSINVTPPWATFSTIDGTLHGTPTRDSLGSYPDIVISGKNSAGTVRLPPFTINVVLPMPAISGAPGTKVTTGDAYSFTPDSTNATSFSILNKPYWASFDLSTGTLSGTPKNSDARSYSGILITAKNGTGSVSLPAFTISVAMPMPAISGTPPTAATTGQYYTFAPVPKNATSFSILNKPYWASFNYSTGALTGRPLSTNVGTYSNIIIKAVNSTGSAAVPPFSIAVALPMPTISGKPPETVIPGRPYSFTPTATTATSFTITNKPSWATFNSASGALTGATTIRNGGVYDGIVISAKNSTGTVSLPAFSITVTPPPPTISGTPAVKCTAGRLYSFTPAATYAASFSITNKPGWASFNPATGALTGTPAPGTFSDITIRAVNFTGSAPLGPFSIAVVPPKPTISGLPASVVPANSSYSFTPASTWATRFHIDNKPSWADFNEESGKLTGTPAVSDLFLYSNIRITAINSTDSAALPTFSIRVVKPLPALSGTPAATVTAGKSYSFTLTATGADSFRIANKPLWATFSTVTGALTGIPTTLGSYPNITIKATNSSGSSTFTPFSITVVPPLPTISGIPPATATTGRGYSFIPRATSATSFSILNKPSWATFSTVTGALYGTPATSSVGDYHDITISARNSTGDAVLVPFSIAVARPWPTISGAPITTTKAGYLYRFAPASTNASGFLIEGQPSWASFDPKAGVLTGIPAIPGTYSNIHISVTNSTGTVALPIFAITVVK